MKKTPKKKKTSCLLSTRTNNFPRKQWKLKAEQHITGGGLILFVTIAEQVEEECKRVRDLKKKQNKHDFACQFDKEA